HQPGRHAPTNKLPLRLRSTGVSLRPHGAGGRCRQKSRSEHACNCVLNGAKAASLGRPVPYNTGTVPEVAAHLHLPPSSLARLPAPLAEIAGQRCPAVSAPILPKPFELNFQWRAARGPCRRKPTFRPRGPALFETRDGSGRASTLLLTQPSSSQV